MQLYVEPGYSRDRAAAAGHVAMQGKSCALTDRLRPIGRVSFIGRREFFGLVGGMLVSPGIAKAQQSLPIIGFLYSGSSLRAGPEISAFWEGMNQGDFEERRNVTALYAFGDGHDERLTGLALDLLNRGASIIVAGGTSAIVAARQSNTRIPVVFVAASVPFTLDRPDQTTTGVSLASPDILAERFKKLLELAPSVKSAAVLVNPQTPNIDVQLGYLSDMAKERSIRSQIVGASNETDFTAALDEIARLRPDALLVANDGLLNAFHARLIALAASSRVPAAFPNREFVEGGGLMSYGPSSIAAYRQAGSYVARILKGEKPAELSIVSPVEMELAINAKTAASLGLPVSQGLIATAAEVIR